MATQAEHPGATAPREKLGLALSGGGFRASFFHVGVLAQMARQGLLRHVEVISTVSGGSIVGALYYLHVKKLLESKPDSAITDHDYLEIIQKIECDFLEAVERNFRMLTFADFIANLKMAFPDYSRSDHIAELYNELIYQAVVANVSKPVQMRELKIYPPGSPHFFPRTDNANRQAKVPILILNATTLNTGRNWHFTAQTMGEPASDGIDAKVIRLRRPRPSYNAMVKRQQDFPLGHAVAASACVPALFHPLAVSELYRDGQDEIRVQLADGGVHDNQGIEGLLYEQCTCFIVSDAAAQMETEHEPATGPVPVLLRTSSILQDRVRAEGLYRLIETRGEDRVAFMHLRKGLAIREIPWIDQSGQPAGPVQTIPATSQNFGVAPEVQDRLSKVRTDLDSFTEVEAYSLMLDGYLMSDSELSRFRAKAQCPHVGTSMPVSNEPWQFLKIAPWMKNPKPDSDYLKQLEVARYTFGKVFFLLPWLRVGAIALVVLVFLALWPTLAALLGTSVPVYVIAAAAILMLVDHFLPKLAKVFRFLEFLRTPFEAVKRFFGRALIPFLGAALVKLYLRFINPRFLARGRFEELKRRDPRE